MLIVVLVAFFALVCYCSAKEPTETGAKLLEKDVSLSDNPSGLSPTETTAAAAAAGTIGTLGTAAAKPSAAPTQTPGKPEDEYGGQMTLAWLFTAGGPVMWPLLLSLLVGVGFSIERGIVYWGSSINVREFMTRINAKLAAGDTKGALALCETAKGPIAAVIKAALLRWDKGRKQVEKAIETAGSGAMSKLERGLTVLASVSNLAPLLGFLGTVTGMIRSFGVIAKAGLSDPSLVASGIAEALITTAAGLIIAIPVLAAYNYYTSVVAKAALQMDESTSELLEYLK